VEQPEGFIVEKGVHLFGFCRFKGKRDGKLIF
jgi:hypothetical protein